MSENRCETCRHFGFGADVTRDVFHDRRAGVCERIRDDWPTTDLATTWDYDGMGSGLYVEAGFGCVLWEDRP